MIAYGINEQGHREFLGFVAYRNESKDSWQDFLQSLKKCGRKGVIMITSDAHEDIIHAVGELFSTVPWQRCEFHFSGNIEEKEKLLVVGKEQATMLAA
jgi:transposase, mutator family